MMIYYFSRRLNHLLIGITPFIFGFIPPSSSLLDTSPPNPLMSQVTFPPSGNRGSPETTTGGGTRGEDRNCLYQTENSTPLVAIMPNRENFAKTASLTPVVYVHVPDTIATQAELVIVNSSNQEVYHTQFNLPKTSGIMKVQIPTEANLTAGNTYKWSFMIICDPLYRYKDKYVSGQMEVVKLPQSTENRLNNVSPLEKAQVYATSELWFETLDTIAQLQPQETQAWVSLLTSVGLESLSEKPLERCCVAQ
ncbi:MAG: DUF928 domain-containing protein [Microcystaceae cyanobacterium]